MKKEKNIYIIIFVIIIGLSLVATIATYIVSNKKTNLENNISKKVEEKGNNDKEDIQGDKNNETEEESEYYIDNNYELENFDYDNNKPAVYKAEYDYSNIIKVNDVTDKTEYAKMSFGLIPDDNTSFAIPFININSKDANIINSKLKSLYEKINRTAINDYKYYEEDNGIFKSLYYLNYKTYYTDSTVSIIMTYIPMTSGTPCYTYYGYIFDLKSGKLLTTKDIQSYINNSSTNQIYNLLEKEINMICNNSNEGKYYSCIGNKDLINDELEKVNNYLKNSKINSTSMNSSINDGLVLYIDSNNKLNVIYPLGDIAACGETVNIFTFE